MIEIAENIEALLHRDKAKILANDLESIADANRADADTRIVANESSSSDAECEADASERMGVFANFGFILTIEHGTSVDGPHIGSPYRL